jgi:predicted transposase YbfD/YdcC
LVRIESQRYHKATGRTEREISYYITSLRADAARLNSVVGQHWGIENKLHWVLDVGFGEDLDRKRAGHAVQNFSVLNRIAVKLLKQDKSFRARSQEKTPESRVEPPLFAQTAGNLIRVGPVEQSM